MYTLKNDLSVFLPVSVSNRSGDTPTHVRWLPFASGSVAIYLIFGHVRHSCTFPFFPPILLDPLFPCLVYFTSILFFSRLLNWPQY